jgi:hypothetical protein
MVIGGGLGFGGPKVGTAQKVVGCKGETSSGCRVELSKNPSTST